MRRRSSTQSLDAPCGGRCFPARRSSSQRCCAHGSGWRRSPPPSSADDGPRGRNGRDRVGFVGAAPGLHQDPTHSRSSEAKPDPLPSSFARPTDTIKLWMRYKTSRRCAHRRTQLCVPRVTRSLTRLERERDDSEAHQVKLVNGSTCRICCAR